MEKYIVQSGHSRDSVLQEFAIALKFPAHFGKNLDALADCLGDLSWLPRGRKVVEWWIDPDFESGNGARFMATVRAIVGTTLSQHDDVQVSIRYGTADLGRNHSGSDRD